MYTLKVKATCKLCVYIPLQQPPEEEHNIKYYLINAYMAVKTFTLVW